MVNCLLSRYAYASPGRKSRRPARDEHWQQKQQAHHTQLPQQQCNHAQGGEMKNPAPA